MLIRQISCLQSQYALQTTGQRNKKKKIDVCFHAIRCPNNFGHHCIPSLNCFLRGNLFGLEDRRGPYHGHVDVVWIAGIVIRSASCLGCLGVACGKKRRRKKEKERDG